MGFTASGQRFKRVTHLHLDDWIVGGLQYALPASSVNDKATGEIQPEPATLRHDSLPSTLHIVQRIVRTCADE